MPIQTDHIRTVITAYLAQHPEDAHEVAVVQGLLDTGCDLTSRKSLPGHVTAGAILVGHDGRVLHILHNATGKWLLPGGHIEPTDDTLLEAAGRELTEETGISPQVVAPHSEVPLHIDVHTIDANPVKGEPAHQHYDFRFFFRTTADIGKLQTEEVTDAAWRPVESLADEHLKRRVAGVLL
ncbi:NUDIX domain-containing protein [Streptomyces coelicoflavus]|uniref:NUDIX hydrolase n=1 Tax=Streptomyces coelicoflavus TaxID=285562 RepID=UPI0024ADFDCE|nr:NUDIX domain-containing protein [Streptomyces coelicoflavus]MDI6519892.1 NUDIX domain-containing protein [Streptomyces coelicoflavus]